MSIGNITTGAQDDSATIAQLKEALAKQRAAFNTDRNPSIEVRRERLGAIMGMMVANRERISAALTQDFGTHPVPAADLIETLSMVGRAQYALEQLEGWMTPSPRHTDPAMMGTARAEVRCQPKGVIGNMVPWNFPFDLSVGPLVEMLAAGNRVIIKPSEYTPACGALLAEMIAATFDPDLVTVVNGGLDLARAFSDMPWDHLLYTGNPEVGKQVMAAAAANLVPVTLELGGKNPAIFTPGSVTPRNVEATIGTKIVKNGQMCTSVDYALVPRGEMETFVDEARAYMDRAAPNYSRSDEVTGIISQRHLSRLSDMLADARERQARVVTLEDREDPDPDTRGMPMSLVIDPPADARVCREEIFGPLLAVMPYDDLDAAVAQVNAGERPLGLYVFGDDEALTKRIVDGTHSGGVTVNAAALQGALPSMGFGGSGTSGMGRHHGIEGFREFSNQRGIVIRGEGDMVDAFYAPYAKAAAIVQAVLAGPQEVPEAGLL